jgi:hypothetical protein
MKKGNYKSRKAAKRAMRNYSRGRGRAPLFYSQSMGLMPEIRQKQMAARAGLFDVNSAATMLAAMATRLFRRQKR